MEKRTMTNEHRNGWGCAWAGLVLCSGLAGTVNGQALLHNPDPLQDPSLEGTLAAYRAATQYGPDSKPLRPENWDLLHPFLTESPSLPLISSGSLQELQSMQNAGLSEQEILSKVTAAPAISTYQFVVNKTILTGTRDELEARLTVTSASQAVPRIHVLKAEVIGDAYFGSPNLGNVPFSCETTAPVCNFRWQASAADKRYWGGLELQVTLSLEGSADEFMARQAFYSSPMVAGKFTGNFHERLENGSLLIDAGVSVQKRMLCHVSANLYSADKEIPTHHATREIIVDPSMKAVTFSFFGKIFTDYQYEGIFRLQDLKAQCENLAFPPEWLMDPRTHQAQLQAFQAHPPVTREPGYIYFEYNDFTYATRAYPISMFSNAEWQSPERTQYLQYLQKAALELADPTLELRKQQQRVMLLNNASAN
jgi:hypothetical protein